MTERRGPRGAYPRGRVILGAGPPCGLSSPASGGTTIRRFTKVVTVPLQKMCRDSFQQKKI